jgi:hypothetical protein
MAIDPEGKIWVCYGTNLVSVIDPQREAENSIIRSFFVGSNKVRTESKKNITFIKRFSRSQGTKQWFAVIYYSDEKQLYFYSLTGVLNEVVDLSLIFDSNVVGRLLQNINQAQFMSEGDPTGYERKRIFNKLSPYKNEPQLVLKAAAKDLSKDSLFYRTFKSQCSIKEWALNSWQHLLLTYRNKSFQLWSNSVNVLNLKVEGQYELAYESQPSFYIGSSTGNALGLNNEVKSIASIFNGKIGDIRIYNYAIPKTNIEMFAKASVVSNDIYWPMPIPLTQYVEMVERVFKHKLPGAKSQFFNLKLKGTNITDTLTREIIEAEIKQIISETKPTYTDLLKIEWLSGGEVK